MALPPEYVDGLYRKVLVSVKASNGIPTDEEDYHFQHKFNQDFRDGVDALGGRVTSLLHRLRKANFPRNDDNGDDDIADFDPLEENGALTDLVDGLLEKATQQIIRFQKGEVDPSPSTAAAPPVVLPTTSKVSSRPQDSFEDKVDNSDSPFVSKLRAKLHAASTPGNPVDDDDDDVYHPYRSEITNLTYQPWQVEPTVSHPGMISLDDATYTYVDTPAALAAMLAELQASPMLAVDLENHSFHSFQGFLCLMQISTWTCDWVVDTLALRSHLHALNAVFCDPTKLKVLHGADSDIVWLQRDLGLYMVNMFDTGQAARALQYPRFSLAYLLQTHCGITADKQYQLADWRVRPLDEHMIKYAREDTRYLLYVYEVLKQELLEATPANLLHATLTRSQALCLSVYAKPRVPTPDDVSYLCFKLKATVGLQVISDTQVRVMEHLVAWRDTLARRADESPGYVCPNAVLMKITKGLPSTPAALFRLCNPIPPLVRKHAHDITVLLKQALAASAEEEVTAASPHVVQPVEPTRVQRRGVVVGTSQLDAFEGWTNVVARTATASKAASLISPKKPKSKTQQPKDNTRPPLFALQHEGTHDDGALDVLEQVRQALASKEFHVVDVSGLGQPTAAAATAAPQRVVTPKKEDAAVPLSLSEKYPKLLKKRKADQKSASTVDDKEEVEEEDKMSFQSFDYAKQSLAQTTMDLDLKPEVRHKRKKGGGYNPFVQATDETGMAPINQKKGYNAPRSSTFR